MPIYQKPMYQERRAGKSTNWRASHPYRSDPRLEVHSGRRQWMLLPVRLKEPAAQRELGEHANSMDTLSCERALLRQPRLKNLVHTKLR